MSRYIIMTSARNAERTIGRTMASVLRQTAPPLRWVIVSDGSDDRTDEIVQACAAQHDGIRFIRREKPAEEFQRIERAAPGKAAALTSAYRSCSDLAFDYVANLDADITFAPDYYERVLRVLDADDRIGIAGGAIRNILPDDQPAPGGFYKPDFVAGAVQMFRRECYEGIGGYKPYGHEDCVAALEAKAQGWTVKNILDLVADHHPPREGYATDVRSKLPTCFYLGHMHYIMREPLWREIPRCIKRCFARPWLIGGCAMGAGYVRAALARTARIPVMPVAAGRTNPGHAFRQALRRLPGLVYLVRRVRRMFPGRRSFFPGSRAYWVSRYDKGGNSGCGSCSHLAAFKAEVLNDFVEQHPVRSIIEYGCGDGRQLKLARYPSYTGFDVSPTAIARCRDLFSHDPAKRFHIGNGDGDEHAELTLSLDVVYHLVEDEVFHAYMNRLFDSATRFVIVYASNTDANPPDQCAHVRHRRFTAWVERYKPEWTLREVIPNRHPYTGNMESGSVSDFHIYERRHIQAATGINDVRSSADSHRPDTGRPGWVSVIIPTYNRADLLDEVLDSVYAQTYRPIELIVVDDGSTDDTAARVADWKARHNRDASFRVAYVYQENRGAAGARNTGARAVGGEFVLWHDSDDVMYPNRIQRTVQELVADGADMCCCGAETSTGRVLLPHRVNDSLESRIRLPVAPHMWLFRRSFLNGAPPWPEDVMAVEDAVFIRECLFATDPKPRIAIVPELLYLHKVEGQDRVSVVQMFTGKALWSRHQYSERRLREIADDPSRDELRQAIVINLLGLAVAAYRRHDALYQAVIQLARAHGSDALWGRNTMERLLLRWGGVGLYRAYWRGRSRLAPVADAIKRRRLRQLTHTMSDS